MTNPRLLTQEDAAAFLCLAPICLLALGRARPALRQARLGCPLLARRARTVCQGRGGAAMMTLPSLPANPE